MKVNLQELRDKRNAKVARMESILSASEGGEGPTAEQSAEFDKLEGEVSELNARISRGEKLAQHQAHLEEPVPSVGSRQLAGDGSEYRARGPEASREFEAFGEFLAAVRFNPNDQRLEFNPEAGMKAEQQMDSGSGGGFAVPQQFRSTLMEVPTAGAVIRPRATVIPAGTPPDAGVTMPALDQGTATQNMFGGVVINWVAEGGTKPETDYQLKEISLIPHEVAGTVTLTDKLLRNWQAAGPLTERLLRSARVATEDDKFIRGLGAGTPEGILQAAGALDVNRVTANEINYADLANMDAALFDRGGQVPVWLTTKKRSAELRQITNPNNQFIWQENAREGLPPLLLGYPVIYHPRMPATLGARADLVLADLSYYLIKDGSGPFVAASEHVKFTTNKTVIKIFWNVDGHLWLTEPVTDEDSAQYSPIVVLDVP